MKITTKRLLSYILDLSVLILFMLILNYILPKNTDLLRLNNNLSILNEMVTNKEISIINYFTSYSTIMQNINLVTLPVSLVQLLYILMYFVLIPYYNKGQTLFQSVFSIQIKSQDKKTVKVKQLLIRSLIINGLGLLILSIVMIFIIPGEYYFINILFLAIIQLYLIGKSVKMVYINKDKLGLHDIYSKTKVEEVKR